MALPKPWRKRSVMSRVLLAGVSPMSSVNRVKTESPYIKILLLPNISESLPNGTRKTADERMYDVTTHPICTAFMLKSFPMEGSTIFVDDIMNGGRNALIAEAIKAVLFSECSAYIYLLSPLTQINSEEYKGAPSILKQVHCLT